MALPLRRSLPLTATDFRLASRNAHFGSSSSWSLRPCEASLYSTSSVRVVSRPWRYIRSSAPCLQSNAKDECSSPRRRTRTRSAEPSGHANVNPSPTRTVPTQALGNHEARPSDVAISSQARSFPTGRSIFMRVMFRRTYGDPNRRAAPSITS